MDIDTPEGGANRMLNRLVALTVVILSVFMGLANIKDDNIVQAMQLAKTDAVDRWGEYQATRTKLHIAETARLQLALAADPARAGAARAVLDREIAKYEAETPKLAAQARAGDARYDALNVHDDQFDMCDALISIALSLAGVAALAETRWLLGVSWAAGGLGLLLGIAGFAGWGLHPDALASLLS